MADQRLGKSHIDDSAFTAGSTLGVPMFARFDDTAVDSVDEDDAGVLRMSSNRNLFVNLRDAAGNERGVNVSAENAAAIAGDVAHDAVDFGNPIKGGGRARTSLPTAVSQDDRVDAIYTLQGAAIMAGVTSGAAPQELRVNSFGELQIEGNLPQDSPDAGTRSVKIGHKAVEHNTDPPTVSADDDRSDSISNPQGMQYVVEGHPNSIHREYMTTEVQTNSILIPTVAAGSQIVLLSIGAFLSTATSAPEVAVRIGFGASAVPTEPTTGNTVDGVPLSHPGLAPGGGLIENKMKIGGDGEELRLACDVPTGGQLTVRYDYYISTL